MGRRARYIPARLPEKLILIRKSLGLTQQEMLGRLELPEEILQTSISQYERGKIEPPKARGGGAGKHAPVKETYQ